MPEDINEKSMRELITIIYDQNKMMVTLQNKINSLEKELKNNNKKYSAVLTNYYELMNIQTNEMAKYNDFVTYLKTYFPAMFSDVKPGSNDADQGELSSIYISPDGNMMKTLNNVHILDVAKYIINNLKNNTQNMDSGIE